MSNDSKAAYEKLIVDVTQDLLLAMERDGISMAALGRTLNRSRAFISSTLNGERNITLRTLSVISFALGLRPRVSFHDRETEAIPEKNERAYTAPFSTKIASDPDASTSGASLVFSIAA